MQKTVFFLDIDDCLIKATYLTRAHLDSLQNALASAKIEKAAEITTQFAAIFNRIYAVHQNKEITDNDKKLIDEYLNRLTQLEKNILDKYGEIKLWSREVCLYIVAERLGIKVSNSVLIYITNKLWNSISQNISFYPDTLPFLRSLQHQKIPFYLVTASDCRLTLDDKTGLFVYNLDYCRRLKLERLKILTDLGIPKTHIFIGDPYDKPNPWVFKLALTRAQKDFSTGFHSVIIGDSVKNDLLPAKAAGVETLIWLNRELTKEKGTGQQGIIAVNKLTAIPKLFGITS